MLIILVVLLVTMVTPSDQLIRRCQCFPGCCGKLCSKAITPRDPYFLEGEDIVLICNSHGKKESWKKLTFLIGPNLSQVPQEYITRLNSTSIQLRIPNITKEDVDNTAKSILYRCVHKRNHSKCFDNVYVRFEYYVHEPKDLQCRDYNLDTLKCTWSLGVSRYHHKNAVNVTCSFKNSSNGISDLQLNNGWDIWEACPEPSNTACLWNRSNYPAPAPSFHVKVTVRNPKRGVSEVIEKTFNKYDIVEPAPVTRVRFTAAERCIQLDWRAPKQNRSFVYNITYKSNCSDEKSIKTFNQSILVCELVPHERYYISIKARLVTMVGSDMVFRERGYWSKLEYVQATTEKDVVDVNPVTLPGLYEVLNTSKLSDERQVTVLLYFTPLTECDLHDTIESVTYTARVYNTTTLVKHPHHTAQIYVPEAENVEVTLQASNSVGHPNGTRKVTVFQRRGLRPSELVVQYNRTNKDCVIMAEILVRENSSKNINHTLVWCEGQQGNCREPLKWAPLGVNVTTYVFTDNLCEVAYRYGLVTHGFSESEGQIVDTGIMWEECIYQYGKVPDRHLVVDNLDVTDVGFTVRWNQYDCKSVKAYIDHYQVTYCPSDGANDCGCKGQETIKNVSREDNSFTVTDLASGSNVCLLVRGISKAGSGPPYKSAIKMDEGDDLPIIAIILGCAVIVCGVFSFIIRYKCKVLMKRFSDIKQITVPTGPEVDVNQDNSQGHPNSSTRLLTSDTSGIGTASEYNPLINQTGITDWHSNVTDRFHKQNVELSASDGADVLPGYKLPDSFNAESGIYESTDPVQSEEDVEDINRSDNTVPLEHRLEHQSPNVLTRISDTGNVLEKSQNESIELTEMSALIGDNIASNIPETLEHASRDSPRLFQNFQAEPVEHKEMPVDLDNDDSQLTEFQEVPFEHFVDAVKEIPDGYKDLDSESFLLDSGDDYESSSVDKRLLNVKSQPVYKIKISDENADNKIIVNDGSCHVQSFNANEHQTRIATGHNISDLPRLEDSSEEVESENNVRSWSICDSSGSSVMLFGDLETHVDGYKQSEDISSMSESSESVGSDSMDDEMSGHLADERNVTAGTEQHSSDSDISEIDNKCLPGNRNSGSGSGSNGNSEVPNYIIKTDQNTFVGTKNEQKETELRSPTRKTSDGTNINGVVKHDGTNIEGVIHATTLPLGRSETDKLSHLIQR